jgi:hypothetical protein
MNVLDTNKKANPALLFFDNQEFIQLMHITKRTARQWRIEGLISYSLVGKKIFYSLSDVTKMLEKYHKQPKTK